MFENNFVVQIDCAVRQQRCSIYVEILKDIGYNFVNTGEKN
jgi:hypothetical protein